MYNNLSILRDRMKKIKITHLTSAHPRYDMRIFHKECSSLAKNKEYIVSLIVADNKGNEYINNVNIYDVGKLSGRVNRMSRTIFSVYKQAVKLDSDIYHFHDPELIPIALLLKKKKKKIIFDIHEKLSLQILNKTYINKKLRKFISLSYSTIENYAAKRFDYLFVPQPSMVNEYLKLNKTELIENFVILNETPKKDLNSKENIIFHPGALNKERGLWNMIHSVKELKNCKLYLAGGIKQIDLTNIKKINSKNIEYLGLLTPKEVQMLYHKTSLGLILYNNVGQYYLSYAVKLFEYMSYGIPVIMPNFGEWVDFNKENECGINVDPTDPNKVKEAILSLLNDPEKIKKMGKNGKKAIDEKYNWDIVEKKLFKVYKELI